MEQSWRVILLAAWLFILWILETVMPLKKNDRSHALANFFFTGTTIVINAVLIYVLLAVTCLLKEFNIGLFNNVSLPFSLELIIGLLMLDLFAAYFSHRVMHMHEVFWRFHQVHHLDEMVDVTTGLRQHPLETLHRFVFLVIGVAILGAPLTIIVIYQTVSSLNALLEHSNIRVSKRLDRILSSIFVTPTFHKVHHSSNELCANSNYGNIFSIWDRLFGTYTFSHSKELTYGIGGSRDETLKRILNLASLPFKKKATDTRKLNIE